MESTPFHRLYKTRECLEAIDPTLLDQAAYSEKLDTHFREMGFNHFLFTNSCTSALELIAELIGFEKGDEVVVPSFGYVSTANAFHRHGAVIRFADSQADHPNMSLESLKKRVNEQTKAVVFIHYGGMCDGFDEVQTFCKQNDLLLIEDAAHAIGCSLHGKPLGSLGDYGAISFHQSKNIHCFAGGLIHFKEEAKYERSFSYYLKGTNKREFEKREVDHYEWSSEGTAYDLPEHSRAFLLEQCNFLDEINSNRTQIFNTYEDAFISLNFNYLKIITTSVGMSVNNAHIAALVCRDMPRLDQLKAAFKKAGLPLYSHYPPLHRSLFYGGRTSDDCPNADFFGENLFRLPIYPNLSAESIQKVADILRQL